MRDEELISKVHALVGNMNLVQQFFVEKAAKNEQQKRAIETEQVLIHNLLSRWKSVDVQEFVDSTTNLTSSTAGFQSNINGSGLTYDLPRQDATSPQPPPVHTHTASNSMQRWRERSNTSQRAASTSASAAGAREYVVAANSGNSSPGRSKGKESHVLRRQTSASPSKQHQQQYPVLPKKRKIPQFNAMSPSHSSEAMSAASPSRQTKIVPEEIVVYPTFESSVSNLMEIQSLIAETSSNDYSDPDGNDNGASVPQSNEDFHLDENISPKRTEQVSTNPFESYRHVISLEGSNPEAGEEGLGKEETHEHEPDDIKIETQNDESSEARPPKLMPAGGRHRSSTRKPTQGSRKSSRTIRPSWKLNNSAETILPNSVPDRGGKEKDDRENDKEGAVSKKRKKLRPISISDQPPVLTSQVEIPSENSSGSNLRRNKTLQCNECYKSFSTQHGLRYHIESHLQLKPFKCNVCFKSFGQKSTLTRHQATTHTKIKAHVCSICKKCFSSRSELQSHRGRHEAKRNVCPSCSRTFIDKRYFKSHVRICTAQRITIDPEGGGSPVHALFQCPTCEKNYRDPNYFKKHISLCTSSKPAN